MRNSSNPNLGIGPRSALVFLVLVALGCVAVAAGSATANKPAHKPRTAKPAPPGTAAANAHAIAERFKVLTATSRRLRSKVAAMAAKHKGVVTETVPYMATADADALYDLTLVVKGTDSDIVNFRVIVTRTEISTGKKTRLLSKQNAYPLTIYARGGKVVVETFAFGSIADIANQKSREFTIKTAVYTAGHSDAALTARQVTSLKYTDDNESFCGTFPLVGGVSDLGEPLVADVKSTCDEKGNSDLDTTRADLNLWKDDGTRRNLGSVAVDSIFSSGYILSGSKLLMPSPFESATAIQDIDSGSLANLWAPDATYYDIAQDGTVALIGFPPDWGDDYYYDEVYATPSAKPSASGESVPPPPPFRPNAKRPIHKYPFVVFPGGNADNPVLVNASRASVDGVHFCGGNLFVVNALDHNNFNSGSPDTVDSFLFGAYFRYGKYEIQLYDTQGHFIRSLVKTHPMAYAGVGCNGDKLILLARRRSGFATTEIGS